ncbi:MAG: heme exporter protein CcmD [Rhodospirillaceae bacterium]|nr:heme exporter protein CcmD [Rhodospirillaceae bacterium]
MDALDTFLQMGGHAKFVWPAYGLGVLGLVGILLLSVKSWKAREAEFAKLKAASLPQTGNDGATS